MGGSALGADARERDVERGVDGAVGGGPFEPFGEGLGDLELGQDDAGDDVVAEALLGVDAVDFADERDGADLLVPVILEVVVDVSSSALATKIVKCALGFSKALVVDMAFLLEGRSRQEFPERVLGSLRLKNVDFKNSQRLVGP